MEVVDNNCQIVFFLNLSQKATGMPSLSLSLSLPSSSLPFRMVERSTCDWVISFFHDNPLDGKSICRHHQFLSPFSFPSLSPFPPLSPSLSLSIPFSPPSLLYKQRLLVRHLCSVFLVHLPHLWFVCFSIYSPFS